MLAASLLAQGRLNSTAELLLGLLRRPCWGTTEKYSEIGEGEMELFLLALNLRWGQ